MDKFFVRYRSNHEFCGALVQIPKTNTNLFWKELEIDYVSLSDAKCNHRVVCVSKEEIKVNLVQNCFWCLTRAATALKYNFNSFYTFMRTNQFCYNRLSIKSKECAQLWVLKGRLDPWILNISAK